MGRYFMVGDEKFVPAPLRKLPPPLDTQPRGQLNGPGTRRVFARLRGDQVMRPTGANLKQTNMTEPEFFIDDNGNVVFAKYIIRLDRYPEWLAVFRENLGPVVWPLYCQPRFGFQDTNADPTDPVNGEYKQQTIHCRLNLVEFYGDPFWTHKGQFVQIHSIDANRAPRAEDNYFDHPELMIKQTVVGTSIEQPVYYIAHQKHGDLIWPNLNHWPLILPLGDLERMPDPMFRTEYNGVTVTVESFIYSGSTVYGFMYPDNSAQGDPGWRVIEEMDISGLGSATYDRRVYVSDWVDTPPPPIKGWTRSLAGWDNYALSARLIANRALGR